MTHDSWQCSRSSWTPLPEVARILVSWTGGEERLVSGSLVAMVTQGGETKLESC